MATPIPEIDRELENRVEALGMEVVEVEWAGSDRRPILRVRVDFPGSRPGAGVTVNDCARVSRELEPWLDDHPLLPTKYVIEVSSPGVERPLHRRRDFVRFQGEEVSVKGDGPLAGGRSRRLQGILLGVEEGSGDEGYGVKVRRKDGELVTIPRGEIARARLVFRWKDEG
ncbi:MAG: ribosome maturation factor RimP [Gemmatimonadota bacterium]